MSDSRIELHSLRYLEQSLSAHNQEVELKSLQRLSVCQPFLDWLPSMDRHRYINHMQILKHRALGGLEVLANSVYDVVGFNCVLRHFLRNLSLVLLTAFSGGGSLKQVVKLLNAVGLGLVGKNFNLLNYMDFCKDDTSYFSINLCGCKWVNIQAWLAHFDYFAQLL